MKHLHLELKVCEGCGILWLRRKQNGTTGELHGSGRSEGNYCAGCVRRLAYFPVSGKRGGGRPRTKRPMPALGRNSGCPAAYGSRSTAAGRGTSQAGAR
jgi:hypothetical protein